MRADEKRARLRRAVPWLWLALSALWAVVVIVTDVPAWPLAVWIAATLGPITYVQRFGSRGSNTKGTHR